MWRGELTPATYASFLDICQSDHKPVYLTFSIPIKQIDQTALKTVKDEIYAEIDAKQVEKMPKVRLSCTSLDFQSVKYRKVATMQISVENETFSKLGYRFRNKSECQCVASWVSVTPECGVIEAKDTVELTFAVCAGEKHMRKARSSPGYFSCFFVFSVEDGSDYFVHLT